MIALSFQITAQSSIGYSVFQSYYMKSRAHTANAMYLIRFDLSFEGLAQDSFIIKGNFNPKDYFRAKIKLADSLKYSNKVFYKYIGEGYMAGQEVKFEVETSMDINKVVEGYGYEEEIMKPADCEINLIYWPKGESKLYAQENFFIYPRGNVIRADYLKRNGYLELNLPYVLRSLKEHGLINGTYQNQSGGLLKVAELKDDKLLVQFDFDLGFFQDILSKNEDYYVFDKHKYGSLCSFNLTYRNGIIRIVTINGGENCGYGQGVQHDGLYRKIDSVVPQFD